jgi:hypothetical protein
MQDEPRLTPAEREFELALAKLRPAPPGIDPAELAWRAAQRRASRSLWAWRGLAGALAAGLLIAVMLRPAPQVIERVTVVERDRPRHVETPRPVSHLGGSSYLLLREKVLSEGIDALAVPTPPPARAVDPPRPMHHLEQLRQMLETGDWS